MGQHTGQLALWLVICIAMSLFMTGHYLICGRPATNFRQHVSLSDFFAAVPGPGLQAASPLCEAHC